jgi:NAD(P)-dependent dehydrogenase (short-subunit alcohol dehydrogenase family)
MAPAQAVLVTGCTSRPGQSPGTGRATALRLHRAGWPVYATGRHPEALRDLAEEGITTLHLDLTDEKSMTRAVDRITDDHGGVGVLVNNGAGWLHGTFEETPIEDVWNVFATNLFGTVRLTQLVLPGMRERGSGHVVMISSWYGLFATAGRGYYQATKHALEAVSDSLRHETSRFGIRVAIVEPGPILGRAVPNTVEGLGLAADQQTGLYDDFWQEFVDFHEPFRGTGRHGRARLGTTAENVARTIERAITARSPRPRYRVGVSARVVPRLRWMVGDHMFDKMSRAMFPTP